MPFYNNLPTVWADGWVSELNQANEEFRQNETYQGGNPPASYYPQQWNQAAWEQLQYYAPSTTPYPQSTTSSSPHYGVAPSTINQDTKMFHGSHGSSSSETHTDYYEEDLLAYNSELGVDDFLEVGDGGFLPIAGGSNSEPIDPPIPPPTNPLPPIPFGFNYPMPPPSIPPTSSNYPMPPSNLPPPPIPPTSSNYPIPPSNLPPPPNPPHVNPTPSSSGYRMPPNPIPSGSKQLTPLNPIVYDHHQSFPSVMDQTLYPHSNQSAHSSQLTGTDSSAINSKTAGKRKLVPKTIDVQDPKRHCTEASKYSRHEAESDDQHSDAESTRSATLELTSIKVARTAPKSAPNIAIALAFAHRTKPHGFAWAESELRLAVQRGLRRAQPTSHEQTYVQLKDFRVYVIAVEKNTLKRRSILKPYHLRPSDPTDPEEPLHGLDIVLTAYFGHRASVLFKRAYTSLTTPGDIKQKASHLRSSNPLRRSGTYPSSEDFDVREYTIEIHSSTPFALDDGNDTNFCHMLVADLFSQDLPFSHFLTSKQAIAQSRKVTPGGRSVERILRRRGVIYMSLTLGFIDAYLEVVESHGVWDLPIDLGSLDVVSNADTPELCYTSLMTTWTTNTVGIITVLQQVDGFLLQLEKECLPLPQPARSNWFQDVINKVMALWPN